MSDRWDAFFIILAASGGLIGLGVAKAFTSWSHSRREAREAAKAIASEKEAAEVKAQEERRRIQARQRAVMDRVAQGDANPHLDQSVRVLVVSDDDAVGTFLSNEFTALGYSKVERVRNIEAASAKMRIDPPGLIAAVWEIGEKLLSDVRGDAAFCEVPVLIVFREEKGFLWKAGNKADMDRGIALGDVSTDLFKKAIAQAFEKAAAEAQARKWRLAPKPAVEPVERISAPPNPALVVHERADVAERVKGYLIELGYETIDVAHGSPPPRTDFGKKKYELVIAGCVAGDYEVASGLLFDLRFHGDLRTTRNVVLFDGTPDEKGSLKHFTIGAGLKTSSLSKETLKAAIETAMDREPSDFVWINPSFRRRPSAEA
jgi:hypothetical protein